MKNTDGRNLPKEVQQHNRDQAIRLFKGGKSRKEIAEIVSVHPDTISKWIRKWKKGGDEALQLKKRGRGSKEQRMLTEAQEAKLKQLLKEKNPRQLKLPFALWNRKAIQSLIEQMWCKKNSDTDYWRLHETLGFYSTKADKKGV